MDLEFSSFSILLTSFLFVFMILKLRRRIESNNTSINLPPGPCKLPVIGNLHQLVNSLPHRRLTDLAKKYGPLMHLQIGELSTVVVSSPEVAKEVLRTHDTIFASRPYNFLANIVCYNITDIVFAPYSDYWRQLRKICTLELLSMKRVQSFRSIREEEVTSLINWIASKAQSPINLTRRIHSLLHVIIFKTVFGMQHNDHEALTSVVLESLELAGGFSVVDMFPSIEGLLQWITGVKPRLKRLHEEIDRIFEDIINQHKWRKSRDQENEDLVDVLLRVQEDDAAQLHLTTDNIKAVLVDFFLGGTDTSTTILVWAMAELIKSPRLMENAQSEVRQVFNRIGRVDETGIKEMKFLKAVIKETMRFHPPVPLVSRECRQRCETKGFEIPIKTRVLINLWAIGRDPNYWSEPNSFIPERFLDSPIDYKGANFEYIPFGAGRRICPGILFGAANMELTLAMLLYHFNWKLPNEMKHEDLNMTESFGLAVRRKEDLHLVPIPYHPSSSV